MRCLLSSVSLDFWSRCNEENGSFIILCVCVCFPRKKKRSNKTNQQRQWVRGRRKKSKKKNSKIKTGRVCVCVCVWRTKNREWEKMGGRKKRRITAAAAAAAASVGVGRNWFVTRLLSQCRPIKIVRTAGRKSGAPPRPYWNGSSAGTSGQKRHEHVVKIHFSIQFSIRLDSFVPWVEHWTGYPGCVLHRVRDELFDKIRVD